MARILGELPGLDRWRRWRISETSTVYVLTASALVKRLLVVVEKETLKPLHLASGFRLTNNWNELPKLQREELLGIHDS